MVTFTQVPANLRVPGFFVEVGSSGSALVGTGQPYRLALLGQMTSAGSATANEPVQVTRAEDALALFGAGSMAYEMVRASLANAPFVSTFVIPMEDPSGGTAAEFTLTVTASSALAGTIPLWIAGRRVLVNVTPAQAQNDIASAIVSAVNAVTDLPVSAAAATNVVTLTAKNTGVVGNDIDVRVAFFDDETLPSGVTIAVASPVAGAGEPDLAAALAALGDEHYNVLAVPYTATALLATLTTELTSRGSATRQIGAVAFTASRGNLSSLLTLGSGQNSEHLVIVAAKDSPSPSWAWAAAAAANVARDAQEDPASPYTSVELRDVLPARPADRLDDTERNQLLFGGIATTRANDGGSAVIERLVTTYQTNSLGAPDQSFLDVTSILTLERFRYEIRQLGAKFARFKVADDGTAVGPGQAVLTPNGLRGELVALYSRWVEQGWAENADAFAEALVVQRDQSDPTRLNVQMSPDVTNPLRVVGALVSFTL